MRVAIDGTYFGVLPGLVTEQLIELSVQAGAEGLNWPFHERFGAADPAGVARQLQAAGQAAVTLGLTSHTSATPGEQATFQEHVAQAVQAAAALDCTVLDAWPRRPEGVSKQQAQEVLRGNLEAVIPMLDKAGCVLSLEFEPDTTIERYAETIEFLAPYAGQVRATADSYHIIRIGDDLAAAAGALADKLGVIHISGSHRGEPGSEGDRCDYAAFVDAAVAAGYRGDLVLQYQPQGEALTSLKRAVALTRRLVR